MSTAIVPKYKDELSKGDLVQRRAAKLLAVGDVLYPRAAVVQAVERFEGKVGEGGVELGKWGVPEVVLGGKVPMVRVVVRYKEATMGKSFSGDSFIQQVGEEFEYLLWTKRDW